MRYLAYILFLLLSTKTLAQDPIEDKMLLYAKANPTTKLFVHFDKNVYSNNENIWFTGYLLKDETFPRVAHSVMAITLIRDVDSTVILNDKFVMDKGLSFGSIKLPDSLLTGSYRLIAYTNRLKNGSPYAVYTQPITIKTNIDLPFKASMRLNDDNNAGNKSHKVLIAVTTNEGRFLPKSAIVYYRYGKQNKVTKTDISGQVLLDLPTEDQLIDPNLYVKLKYGNDSSFISMAVPQSKSKASVKFYPEGGNFVAGLQSTIGWEVKDQKRMPIALKAFLYENNKVIDTIETSSYGIGKFKLIAEKNADYSVKLVHDGLVDSLYHLPRALDHGLVLFVQEAAVKDTLRIILRTNGTQQINIRVHNFKESFLETPFNTESNIRSVKIPLKGIPKGLTTLTITDSLNRPLAERLFFAHYEPQANIRLTVDTQSYYQRSNINLNLDLMSGNSTAILSVAVVQDNRFETSKTDDIQSFTYLKSELRNLPVHVKGNSYQDKNYVEQILLVKGWTKYTWQNLLEASAIANVPTIDSLKITGFVRKNNDKPIKNPIDLGIFGGHKLGIIKTDSSGLFQLHYDDLVLEGSKKMYLFLNEGNKFSHIIKMNDPYEKLGIRVAKTTALEAPILPSTLTNNAELALKSNEKSIRLKEVLITSRPDHSFAALGANACGDYVCMFNILNCLNHSTGTSPVKGREYKSSSAGGKVIYQGCDMQDVQGFTLLTGIHEQKEFYNNDYKDPQEPAFFSTIYWNHAILLKEGKPAHLKFHSSDITGSFRVVVQGVTDDDVIYAEKFFEVKPKVNP